MCDLCILFSFGNRTFSNLHREPHTPVCGSLCANLCEFCEFFLKRDKFSLLPFFLLPFFEFSKLEFSLSLLTISDIPSPLLLLTSKSWAIFYEPPAIFYAKSWEIFKSIFNALPTFYLSLSISLCLSIFHRSQFLQRSGAAYRRMGPAVARRLQARLVAVARQLPRRVLLSRCTPPPDSNHEVCGRCDRQTDSKIP